MASVQGSIIETRSATQTSVEILVPIPRKKRRRKKLKSLMSHRKGLLS